MKSGARRPVVAEATASDVKVASAMEREVRALDGLGRRALLEKMKGLQGLQCVSGHCLLAVYLQRETRSRAVYVGTTEARFRWWKVSLGPKVVALVADFDAGRLPLRFYVNDSRAFRVGGGVR